MEDHCYIVTREGGISLEEWEACARKSRSIKMALPVEGINPFTKKASLFYPRAGAASIDTPGGHFAIEYRAGELIVTASAAGSNASQIVQEIAIALGAAVRGPCPG